MLRVQHSGQRLAAAGREDSDHLRIGAGAQRAQTHEYAIDIVVGDGARHEPRTAQMQNRAHRQHYGGAHAIGGDRVDTFEGGMLQGELRQASGDGRTDEEVTVEEVLAQWRTFLLLGDAVAEL